MSGGIEVAVLRALGKQAPGEIVTPVQIGRSIHGRAPTYGELFSIRATLYALGKEGRVNVTYRRAGHPRSMMEASLTQKGQDSLTAPA